MKSLKLFVALLLLSINAFSTDYYFSASGNDANSGLSSGSPWQTIAKFNSIITGASVGSRFLFNRGDVFYGKMVISKSGISGSPMTIGAYGTGAAPIITGFTTVSAWTNLGANIWESTNAVSTLATLSMVNINGTNTPMGRTPNTGYYQYQTHGASGTDSTITSSALTGSPNWTGAEVSFYSTTYSLVRATITSQSSSTISFSRSPGILYQPYSDYQSGYFLQQFIIQNDARTLDVQNEWYYNPSTKKIRIYSTAQPTNVQVSTIASGTVLNNSYITFDNISFTGFNSRGIDLQSSNYPVIQNCSFDFIGRDGVNCTTGNTSYPLITNSTFNHINNTGINFSNAVTGGHATISGNTLTNIAMVPFCMANSGATNESAVGCAIISPTPYSLVNHNSIDYVGGYGVYFFNSYSHIDSNFINHYCQYMKDGGGIYSWNGPQTVTTGITIKSNIVLNANTGVYASQAIYLDYGCNGIDITNNSVSKAEFGLWVNGFNVNVKDNTSYDNYESGFNGRPPVMTNVRFARNIYFAKLAYSWTGWYEGTSSSTVAFTSDSNWFAKPIGVGSKFIQFIYGTWVDKTLAQIRTLTGQELHSVQYAKSTPLGDSSRFEYNATASPVTISLPYNYEDVKGVQYNGTITLQPYTSAVLIQNGAITGGGNINPVANAGPDQTITLPTSSVTLSGSGTDADGTIVSYLWTKSSGGAGTITSNTSASTTVTGLVAGTYQFTLLVTDNLGGTNTDPMQVIVNPSGGINYFIIRKGNVIYK